ncbi:DMT family transporter [Exiguobacterium sp. LL15]|uniref:DMT family transporter n=1 Tax=Exiguobacterium sp. LL15 TaxID=2950547 RepID=UPI00210E83C4|nr:DMT family transporter [Exiguobacterium sp. LL15]
MPYFTLFMALFFISTSAIFVKWAETPIEAVAFYRMLFSTLLLLPLIRLKELLQLSSSTIRHMLLSGILLAGHFWLWFLSLDYTTVASSTLFVTASPIFVLAGNALFFKQHPSRKALLFVAVALFGGGLVAYGDIAVGMRALIGDGLALLATILVAGYWLLGQHVRTSVSTNLYSFGVYAVASLVLLLLSLIQSTNLVAAFQQDWWLYILLAVFPTLLGHNLFNWALARVSASIISITILGEAVWGMIFGYYLFDEKLTWIQITGAALLLIGIGLFLRRNERDIREQLAQRESATSQSS